MSLKGDTAQSGPAEDAVPTCMNCGISFNPLLLRFKYRCHDCGNIFCGNCTNFTSLPHLGIVSDEVRVCAACLAKEGQRRALAEAKKLKHEEQKLRDVRLRNLFDQLAQAYQDSDEARSLKLKSEIDLLRNEIYARELKRQEKKKHQERKLQRLESKSKSKVLDKSRKSDKKAHTSGAATENTSFLDTADTPESVMEKLTEKSALPFQKLLNPPVPGKCCLVLDVDYTLFDHLWHTQVKDEFRKEKEHVIPEFQRPYLHQFLQTCYQRYDLVIWSATGFTAIDSKLTNLGIYTNPTYKISLVLSKDHMISIKRTNKKGVIVADPAKPLEILWKRFPECWSPSNTIHIDDSVCNFQLNPQNGLAIAPYKEASKLRADDKELIYLTKYLLLVASEEKDFSSLNHKMWKEYTISKLWERQNEFVIPEPVVSPSFNSALLRFRSADKVNQRVARPIEPVAIGTSPPQPMGLAERSSLGSNVEVPDENAQLAAESLASDS